MTTDLQSCGTEDHLSCTTVTTTLHLTDEFVRDVFTTAIEGGINYWARIVRYHWDDPDPAKVNAVIIDDQADGASDVTYRITLATVVKGIEHVLAKPQLRTGLAAHILVLDAGDIDADDADVIVQMGLFDGNVVYG